MNDTTLLVPWIRRFLFEHFVRRTQSLALNTQAQLPRYACLAACRSLRAGQYHQPLDRSIDRADLPSARVRSLFCDHLQAGCVAAATTTRNQRLGAIHPRSANFIGTRYSPEHLSPGALRYPHAFPSRRPSKPVLPLSRQGRDGCPPPYARSPHQQGRSRLTRLLLFLYNSGARVERGGAADHRRYRLGSTGGTVAGKGSRFAIAPSGPSPRKRSRHSMAQRASTQRVFLNRCGQPITRFGIHTLVERCVHKAATVVPTLASKRVSPHTLRHTTAVFLLRAGVDINTIRAWLGHVSINTTQVYAELDMEMKAKALQPARSPGKRHRRCTGATTLP